MKLGEFDLEITPEDNHVTVKVSDDTVPLHFFIFSLEKLYEFQRELTKAAAKVRGNSATEFCTSGGKIEIR